MRSSAVKQGASVGRQNAELQHLMNHGVCDEAKQVCVWGAVAGWDPP
jgi:hypothetical protein